MLAGRIYLNALGRPDQALPLFRRYLARGGSLSPEALAGTATALDRLGRHREAAAARKRLLSKYPDSAPALRARPKTP